MIPPSNYSLKALTAQVSSSPTMLWHHTNQPSLSVLLFHRALQNTTLKRPPSGAYPPLQRQGTLGLFPLHPCRVFLSRGFLLDDLIFSSLNGGLPDPQLLHVPGLDQKTHTVLK